MSWSWCPTREFVIVHLVSVLIVCVSVTKYSTAMYKVLLLICYCSFVSVLIVSISVTRYSTAMYKVGWPAGEEKQGGGGLRQVGDDEVVDGGGGGGGDIAVE